MVRYLVRWSLSASRRTQDSLAPGIESSLRRLSSCHLVANSFRSGFAFVAFTDFDSILCPYACVFPNGLSSSSFGFGCSSVFCSVVLRMAVSGLSPAFVFVPMASDLFRLHLHRCCPICAISLVIFVYFYHVLRSDFLSCSLFLCCPSYI